MLLWVLSCAVGAVCLWASLRWRSTREYWARRQVPHLRPHPLLGSVRDLLTNNPAVYFRKYYERFRDKPYVGIWLLWQPALIINSPALARRVFVTDFDVFKDRNLSVGESDPIGFHNIFIAKEPHWSYIRKKISTCFTSAKLRTFQYLITKKTSELTKRIKSDLEDKKVINLRPLYTDFSTDVISEVLFGISSDATIGGYSALRDVTLQFMEFSLYRALGWRCIFFKPTFAKFLKSHLFPVPATVSLKKIYQAAVAQRGGYEKVDQTKQRNDLIDSLINLKLENKDMPEDVLVAQAGIMLQGGYDTTASVLTFCTYELAFYPDIQNKMYEEFVLAKQKNDDVELNDSVLSELIYFDCVIKETLRKYSSMQWLDRVAARDYKIDDKLTISAGTPVYVNGVGMAYDPDNYSNPQGFHPERFLSGNNKADPFTFMPFGEGPRHCIAKRLGLQIIRHALSTVILNYRLQPMPGACKPGDYMYHVASVMLTPEKDISVKFISRN